MAKHWTRRYFICLCKRKHWLVLYQAYKKIQVITLNKPQLHYSKFIALVVERILLKRSVQHRVKTPPNVTFLHICDPVIWFKNQGSYTGFAKEGKISILWLSYRGSDHLLVIEDDIIEKHLVLLTTPLSPSLAMFRINNLPSTPHLGQNPCCS